MGPGMCLCGRKEERERERNEKKGEKERQKERKHAQPPQTIFPATFPPCPFGGCL